MVTIYSRCDHPSLELFAPIPEFLLSITNRLSHAPVHKSPMILFRSTPKPIWRQTWLRLLLLSGGTAGLAVLMMPRVSSDWVSATRQWIASATVASADSNRVEVFNEGDALGLLQPLNSEEW